MNYISRTSRDVFICMQGRLRQIDIEDIIYVEHCRRTIFFYTSNGVVYIPYLSLSRIAGILGDDYLFQCHKSFLVNRIHIDRVDRTENVIILKNEMGEVAMGRKYKVGFLTKLHYM